MNDHQQGDDSGNEEVDSDTGEKERFYRLLSSDKCDADDQEEGAECGDHGGGGQAEGKGGETGDDGDGGAEGSTRGDTEDIRVTDRVAENGLEGGAADG